MMNKTGLIMASICLGLGILSIPQKSQAIEVRELLDEMFKRGLCATVQSNNKNCQPNTDTLPTPTSTPTPEAQTTGEPQNTPTDSNTPQSPESRQ
ncbi:hypothetical protein CAL7716_105160 (plasmid) [Calothrix sp. PCC 7716]|nr:hypothetical protein CAL7716_105160 [Calothrix sp. PCC 7716]